jgi:hypothetical protein
MPSSSAAGGLLLPGPPGFAIRAQALPFLDGNRPSPGRVIEVALPAPPSADEAFVLSAPRGTFTAGTLFGLRLPGSGRLQLLLGRALEVTGPPAADFDLVGAHLVRPVSDGLEIRTRDEPTAVATLEREVSIRLMTLVVAGERVRLEAPRGNLGRGMYFALRYFDTSGAKRGLVRVDSVRALSGMLDEVEAVLIGTPTPASERKSFRAPFDLFFSAEVVTPDLRQVSGRLTDLSADGAGIHVDSTLHPGDRIRIGGHALPDLSGAELAIVRTDPHQSQRHGARFLEPNRGVLVLTTLLRLDRAGRSPRREIEIPAVGRSREAVASPLTLGEVEQIPR